VTCQYRSSGCWHSIVYQINQLYLYLSHNNSNRLLFHRIKPLYLPHQVNIAQFPSLYSNSCSLGDMKLNKYLHTNTANTHSSFVHTESTKSHGLASHSSLFYLFYFFHISLVQLFVFSVQPNAPQSFLTALVFERSSCGKDYRLNYSFVSVSQSKRQMYNNSCLILFWKFHFQSTRAKSGKRNFHIHIIIIVENLFIYSFIIISWRKSEKKKFKSCNVWINCTYKRILYIFRISSFKEFTVENTKWFFV
jgi:hypothetical protein